MDTMGKMTAEQKAQWREWLLAHPEWQEKIRAFIDRNIQLIANKNMNRMFWHDLVNVLAWVIGEAQLKRMMEGKK